MVNYIAILLIPVTFTGAGFAQADANYVLLSSIWVGLPVLLAAR